MRIQGMLIFMLVMCLGLSVAAHAGIRADVAADYQVGALGQTSADVGIADSAGDGSWNYYQSDAIIMSEATASALLVVKSTLGLADPTGYGGDGGYDLPAIADSKLFSNGVDPADNELSCHSQTAAGSGQHLLLRWTAGPSSAGSVKISGNASNPVVGGAVTDSISFHIVVDDVIVYEVFADGLTLDAPFDVDAFVSAGDTVDFVVTSQGNLGADETLLSATIESNLGTAHTPVPADKSTVLSADVPATTSVSWYSPLQDENGDSKTEPNIVSVDNFDVYLYSVPVADVTDDDPNFVGVTPVDRDLNQSMTITPQYDYVYFWRVDTTVTWDSNEFTGTPSTQSVVQGSAWRFTTEPEYTAPELTFNNVITTLDIVPAMLSADVTENSTDIVSVDFTLLTDDAEFPAGSDAVLTPTTSDNQFPTATLSTTMEGVYKVKLAITDAGNVGGGPTTVEAIAEVQVYADSCAAQKAEESSAWVQNPFDLDGNCLVDLLDFAEVAKEWLDDSGLDAQEDFARLIGFVPQDIFDIRIEAEDVIDDPNDPNSCSNHPFGAPGIRTSAYDEASGGLSITHAADGAFVEYIVDVPVSAVGNPVDVWVGHSLNATTNPTLSFGTRTDAAAYGTTDVIPISGNWWWFVNGTKVGQVTFTASGPQTVRVTFNNGGFNVDWFSFDW